jgi:4'-phosphopantetheinyl transferase
MGVWQIAEPEGFFRAGLSKWPALLRQCAEVGKSQRRLELLASRYLVSLLLPDLKEVDLGFSEKGRPFISDGDVFVSISHTTGYAAAVVAKKAVGIDIQKPDNRIERLAVKFSGKEEMSEWSELASKAEACHWIWSAKEAVFKAYGRGGVDFRGQIKVSPGPDLGKRSGRAVLRNSEVRAEYDLWYRTIEQNFCVLAVERSFVEEKSN